MIDIRPTVYISSVRFAR